MAQSYSIAEARSNLAAIIGRISAGSAIELTRRGEPVAVLISPAEFARLRGGRTNFREAYRALLAEFGNEEVGLAPEFAQSLRDRSPGRDVPL